MLAIVSDVHSNIVALRAVMEHIRSQGCHEVICLGDVIGYGPRPRECLEVAMQEFSVCLTGNHEWAILNGALGFNPVAKRAVDWHRAQLQPKWYSPPARKDAWDYLKQLPLRHQRGKLLFVHASPSNPTEEYLLRQDVDEILGQLTPKLKRAFDQTEWVTFVGHTHFPGIFTEDARFITTEEMQGRYELEEGKKVIVNVGSVGQPRDGDHRACYITLEDGVITYHRVEYDVEETYNQVIETGGALDKSLGERLLSGS